MLRYEVIAIIDREKKHWTDENDIDFAIQDAHSLIENYNATAAKIIDRDRDEVVYAEYAERKAE